MLRFVACIIQGFGMGWTLSTLALTATIDPTSIRLVGVGLLYWELGRVMRAVVSLWEASELQWDCHHDSTRPDLRNSHRERLVCLPSDFVDDPETSTLCVGATSGVLSSEAVCNR